jgi:hypothetical protein
MRYFTVWQFWDARYGFAENEAPHRQVICNGTIPIPARQPAVPALAIDGARMSGLAMIGQERSAVFTEAGAAEGVRSERSGCEPGGKSRNAEPMTSNSVQIHPLAGALGAGLRRY